MPIRKPFDIAVIGGGIAGLTCALALQHRGIKVQVYEAAGHFGEIGAGVAFTSNAVQAMQICAPGIYQAFTKVTTRNLWPSKSNTTFDFYDGWGDGKGNAQDAPVFSVTGRQGLNGVHRAHFLDELVKLVPSGVAHFGKRLDGYSEREDGRLVMHFRDGTTAEADAIIGCDGIKSKVRELMYGAEHPCTAPSFTHTCAYRGLVPMADAIAAVGEEKACNSSFYLGPGGHVLTFPVNEGEVLNLVAFHRSWEDWTDHVNLTRPAHRDDALRQFAGYRKEIVQLLELTKPDLDVWAIFDTGDHPPPVYNKGRVCMHGDAAHATTPHHGAGAGFCIEGSAVMAALLADDRVQTRDDLAAALDTFNATRRSRTAWLVQSSRYIGEVYDWQKQETGKDFAKIEAEIVGRSLQIADVDVNHLCTTAQLQLTTKLGKSHA